MTSVAWYSTIQLIHLLSSIVPALPSVPIPPLVSSFFSLFPLVIYPAPPTSTPPPTVPQLWLLGPPPSTGSKGESLDPASRKAQAIARFNHFNAEPRWLLHGAGAPGQELPALHLPNGELLGREEIAAHLLGVVAGKHDASSSSSPKPAEATAADPTHQAYTSLLRTSLLPAVLVALHLCTPTALTPAQEQPYLSALVTSFQAQSVRAAKIAEVKRLRGGKEGARSTLDLEAVERDAVTALGALEAKLRETEADGEWFGGVGYATLLSCHAGNDLLTTCSALQSPDRAGRQPLLAAFYHSRTAEQQCRAFEGEAG